MSTSVNEYGSGSGLIWSGLIWVETRNEGLRKSKGQNIKAWNSFPCQEAFLRAFRLVGTHSTRLGKDRRMHTHGRFFRFIGGSCVLACFLHFLGVF